MCSLFSARSGDCSFHDHSWKNIFAFSSTDCRSTCPSATENHFLRYWPLFTLTSQKHRDYSKTFSTPPSLWWWNAEFPRVNHHDHCIPVLNHMFCYEILIKHSMVSYTPNFTDYKSDWIRLLQSNYLLIRNWFNHHFHPILLIRIH